MNITNELRRPLQVNSSRSVVRHVAGSRPIINCASADGKMCLVTDVNAVLLRANPQESDEADAGLRAS
jgi:hypothetical protein